MTQQTLTSKRVAFKINSRGSNQSLINAHWPEDRLLSTTAPVLCFVLAGPVMLPLGDYVAHCLPGHAILMPAGTPRPDGSLSCLDESRTNNGYCSMLSFMAWAGGVECWRNHTINGEHNKGPRNPKEHCHVLHAQANLYLETLAEEAVTRPQEYRLHCNSLLSALVAVLMREIQQQRAFHPQFLREDLLYPAIAAQLQEQNPIKRAQSYIESHLHESPSIDRVASHVHMSRAYFTRQFRRVTGKSFTEYTMECRLEKGKVLLVNTNWQLCKISEYLGISPGHLRNIFLRYEQQIPADFRRKSRSDQ